MLSHIDAMSRAATLPDIRIPVAALPEFEKFQALIVAASGFVPHFTSLQMMSEVMHQQTLQQLELLTSRPDFLVQQLERSGEVLLLSLVKANIDHLAKASTITELFDIPKSTLHREKDAGRVIAYRSTKGADFVFPVEQFSAGGIADWAADVIHATDNGAPALHFLYVPREHLGGESFAAALRARRGRDVSALIKKAAARLSAE